MKVFFLNMQIIRKSKAAFYLSVSALSFFDADAMKAGLDEVFDGHWTEKSH